VHVLAMKIMRGYVHLLNEKEEYSDIYRPYFYSLSSDAELMRYVWYLYGAQDFGSKAFRSFTLLPNHDFEDNRMINAVAKALNVEL
jgi:hypothetical protein